MKPATAVLYAIIACIGSNASAADISDIIKKLKSTGTISESNECGTSAKSYSLEYENPSVNGQRFDTLAVEYAQETGTSNAALMVSTARSDGERLYVHVVADGDDISSKLDGNPDIAWKQSFDFRSGLQFIIDLMKDPCGLQKRLETQGTTPDVYDKQIYDAGVQFALRQR